jgi:hypothetical protein
VARPGKARGSTGRPNYFGRPMVPGRGLMADEVGGPVRQLEPNEPLNRALGAFQLAFNAIHAACMDFLEEGVWDAERAKIEGWLDIKLTLEGNKLILRRRCHVGKRDNPGGKWWTIPVWPEMLRELLERLKPEAPKPERPPVDIDASEAKAAPAKFDPATALEARRRELRALATNIAITRNEMVVAGYPVYSFVDIKESADALDEGLVEAIDALQSEVS